MNHRHATESSLIISRSGVPYDEPDNRQPYQRQLAIYLILASTTLERVAFYSLVINLVISLHMSELDWDPGNSITVSFIFSGISYIWTLIFAALSDAKLGRAKTIVIGFSLYILGYIFIILITKTDIRASLCGNSSGYNSTGVTPLVDEHCFGPLISTLIFTAMGVGAVHANMAVFGAEQVRESDKPSRYFDKYVVAVNIGALFAALIVSYIQDFRDYPDRYFYGYLFAGASLVVGVTLFILGIRFYIHINPYDTIITKCIPVVINAFQTWRKSKVDQEVLISMRTNSFSSNSLCASTGSRPSEPDIVDGRVHSFLDYARARNNGKYIDRIVDDVKSLRRVIVVFLFLIPYWLIYYQIQTTFFLQGQQMHIPDISNDPKMPMPVIWMSVGDQVTIFIGILILNLFVYKRSKAHDQSSLLQTKFLVGMVLASVTMVIAGTVEKIRQNNCSHDNNPSHLSIFAQLPQYISMGLSEVFVMVASYEFAYMAAPRSAQSLIMSLRFCSLGLSSFVGDVYVKIFARKNDIFDFDCLHNGKRFYVYFYVLGCIQLLTIPIFLLCNRKFGILQLNQRIISRRQFI